MTKKGLVFYGYDKCSTCRDAEKALRARGVEFDKIALVDAPPDAKTLRGWMKRADVPLRRWVNVSGQSYRALVAASGKDAVDALVNDPDKLAEALASDGKLVKRPLLVGPDTLIIGFDKSAYEALGLRFSGERRRARRAMVAPCPRFRRPVRCRSLSSPRPVARLLRLLRPIPRLRYLLHPLRPSSPQQPRARALRRPQLRRPPRQNSSRSSPPPTAARKTRPLMRAGGPPNFWLSWA